MGYIGQPLNAGNLSVQTGTGDGSDTTPIATLNYSVGSSESVAVYLDGVYQTPSTDYTASGTTLTFTTAPPNGVSISVVFLALPISLPTPGDSTVTSAKIVDGAIVNADINASAAIARTKLANPGAWVLIGTQEASNDASLTQTGLDSTYDTYVMVLSDIIPGTDTASLQVRLGDSSGIDSGASDYAWYYQRSTESQANNTLTSRASAGASSITTPLTNIGTASTEGAGGIFYLHTPSDSTAAPIVSGLATCVNSSTQLQGGYLTGYRQAVITCDRIQIIMSSGNIASGRMSVYGIAHT